MPEIPLGAVADGSAKLSAYLARPSGSGPWPGVVAIHEGYGPDDVFRRNCERVAAAGYLTIGPDLFSDGGVRRCVLATFRALFAGHGKAFADIAAGRQWLLDQADCTGKLGIIGFCMGGGFALVASTSGFDASAANYGQVPRGATKALAGACPIIAHYGKRDVLMIGQAARLEKALSANGVEHDIKVYPDAGHSFLNDAANGPAALRPLLRVAGMGPEPASSADAWARIEAFFAAHLG